MLNLKLITDIEFDGIDWSDYPDFCDAQVVSAVWSDDGRNLTEAELDVLNFEHSDFVYEKLMEHLY